MSSLKATLLRGEVSWLYRSDPFAVLAAIASVNLHFFLLRIDLGDELGVKGNCLVACLDSADLGLGVMPDFVSSSDADTGAVLLTDERLTSLLRSSFARCISLGNFEFESSASPNSGSLNANA